MYLHQKNMFSLIQMLSLSIEDRDAEELVLVLRGYYQLMAGTELPVEWAPDSSCSDENTGNTHPCTVW
jgi:hypothetical protein